jgi:hypothetical protein
MAAANIVISGMMYHAKSGESTPITIVGIAGLSGLEVGGGPIYPPSAGGPPGQPTFPIWGPPGFNPPGPGYPPGISGGPIIPPPTVPPENPSAPKPPPPEGGWGWHPEYGWGYFPMGGGKPQPPA